MLEADRFQGPSIKRNVTVRLTGIPFQYFILEEHIRKRFREDFSSNGKEFQPWEPCPVSYNLRYITTSDKTREIHLQLKKLCLDVQGRRRLLKFLHVLQDYKWCPIEKFLVQITNAYHAAKCSCNEARMSAQIISVSRDPFS